MLILALAIVFLVLNKIIKSLIPSREQRLVNQAAGQIKSANLSYSNSQYSIWADALFQAMRGWGTDERTIFRIFGYMRTPDDVYQLIKVFGVREAYNVSIRKFSGNLVDWLHADLTSKELQQLNSILANINVYL
jgi:hypothetical protein